MIERVVLYNQPVVSVCQQFHVSRPNYYKWLRRYRLASQNKKLEALQDKNPEVKRYYHQIPGKFEEAVLAAVAQYPEFGVVRIVEVLPKIAGKPIVGYHGVQNVLRRNDLSTYEKRLIFAQAQVTPVTRLISLFESFGTRFAYLPVEARQRIIKFTAITFLIAFSTTIFFGVLEYFAVALVVVPRASLIGLFFASVALTVGSFFFAYSMKYYLTLALVLSFSRQSEAEGGGVTVSLGGRVNRDNGPENGNGGDLLQRIFGLVSAGSPLLLDKLGAAEGKGGLQPSLDHVKLERFPFVSVHLPLYNEKKVAERLLDACASMDYPSTRGSIGPSATSLGSSGSPLRSGQVPKAHYEIIVCDDSTDETVEIVQRYAKEHNLKNPNGPRIKILHRKTREGFKGGALSYAVEHMDPKTEFVVVFDADFVPYPDTLELFVKNFQVNGLDLKNSKFEARNSKQYRNSNGQNLKDCRIAAVGGYQWHVLNKSENWITRGIRSEYAGSYVIERSGQELLGALKMISGSVYMIRADVLAKIGWGTSITEDFQLTLRLYAQGYKVVYTPYVQAPAECVSTLKRLIRQRMRWAEGHSNNIRRMFRRLMFGHWKVEKTEKVWVKSPLTVMEKLEFLYLSPYYLQAAFFLVGTFSWLLAETVFRAKLPFWTSLWGWSLVLTNLLALPLMNAVGLFLEESEERDYLGILSFVFLSYILVPFQAYASVKGFLEKEEGPWFRTPKTGKITDIFTRGRFYRWISGILPGRVRAPGLATSIREGLPAVAYSRFTNYDLRIKNNPYLALATANNRFHSFELKPKRNRLIGKIALFLVVGLSSVFSYFGNRVPQGAITNFPIQARVEVQRQDDLLFLPVVSMFKPKEVLAQSFMSEKFFNPLIVGETKEMVLILVLLLSLGLFLSLLRRKRRFVMSIVRLLFIFSLVTSWILASWPPIWKNPRIPPKIPEARAAYPAVASYEPASSSGAANSLTLTKPSSVQVGDLLLIIVGNDDNTATAQWDDVTYKPSGFTLINEVGNSTVDCHAAAFYRVADGTEGSTIDVSAQSADDYWGFYIRVTGIDQSTPINATGADSTSSGTSISITSVDTSVAETLAFYNMCYDGADDGGFTASDTGWSETAEGRNGTTSSNASGSWGTKQVATAGATGAVTVTPVVSDGMGGFQFAVAPSNAPSAPTLYNEDGGSNQIAFNNIRANDTTPIIRASAIYTSTFNRFQVEFNTASDFSETAYTETFSGTYSSGVAENLQTTVSLNLPNTNGVTYYVRAKASADGGTSYGSWSSGTWTYTYTSSAGDPEWFQTTDEQFATGTLSNTSTSGSDSVKLGAAITATGGTTSESGGYKFHTFTSSGTFQVTAGSGNVEVLVVGGGGAGATGGTAGRGGGGAGGLVYDAAYSVTVNSYTVTVGGGGATGTSSTTSGSGGNSVFDTLTALGGGGAGPHATAGTAGGSGGGGSGYSGELGGAGNQPGSASGGYGNAGGASYNNGGVAPGRQGGGGGAGAAGQDGQSGSGGNGGVGLEYSQFASVGGSPAGWFSGGGGGGAGTDDGGAGSGGQGGGGAGGSGVVGTAGTANTGGGGGGSTTTGGAGGSGIVIVRYSTSGASSGTIMSPEIDFDWFDNATAWNDIYWTEDEDGGTIKVQLWYDTTPTTCDTCDAVIPNAGLSGNESWFTTSSVDISTLDKATYSCICIKAQLDQTTDTPYLQSWGVSVPENPLLLFGLGSFVLGYLKKLRRKKSFFAPSTSLRATEDK
jgi:cellulose synthase/poly-beta-1,6-N-acetylglucosamine synthase-like glycosyltransferase